MRMSDANWFAIRVKSGSENAVVGRLSASVDPEAYRIRFAQKEQHLKKAGDILTRRFVAFPGYVFVVTEKDPESVKRTFQPLLKTSGLASRFVRYGDDPNDIALHDADRALLCSLLDDDFVVETLKVIRIGERIEIADGMFGGATAVVKKVNNRKRSLLAEFRWRDKRIQEWFGFEYAE